MEACGEIRERDRDRESGTEAVAKLNKLQIFLIYLSMCIFNCFVFQSIKNQKNQINP